MQEHKATGYNRPPCVLAYVHILQAKQVVHFTFLQTSRWPFDDFLNSALCVQHNFFAVLIDCAMTLSAVILSSTIPILLYELREKF